jgi:rod shape-determining protein MreC
MRDPVRQPRRQPGRRPGRQALRERSHGRLLAALVTVSALVLVLDVAGGPGPGSLRSMGGIVFGPLERLASPAGDPHGAAAVGRTTHDDLTRRAGVEADGLAALGRSPETRDRRYVAATVVAVGRQGAAGPERVTIDAGSRDGVRADLAVVGADGLVGRVVAVSPWTADVLVLGAANLAVAVRVGEAGTLGAVGTTDGPRSGTTLDLRLVERGDAAVGDVITTLGSPGGRPFPAGLRVGTVAALDRTAGTLVPRASVAPAVDSRRLDVVGVLVDAPRATPRPVQTARG